MKNFLFNYNLEAGRQKLCNDIALLILRVSVGLMMAFSHGWGKLQKFIGDEVIQFADPIGVGPDISLMLAAGAEFFLSLLLVVGFMTRISTLPLIFTMLVAVFIVHGNHPFAKMEFGLLYLFPYIAILLMGPGKFSFDYFLSTISKKTHP